MLRSLSRAFALFFILSPLTHLSAEQEILVVGKKQTLGDHPESVSELDSSDHSRGRTLEEALEKESSVRVKRYGGQGAPSSISIRGSNPNQTNLYLDGIPLNNAVTGEANLSDYNLDGIDRIQIFKSGQSAQFSGSAIGGAVNLVPGMGAEHPGSRVRLRGGSEKTIDLSAQTWSHRPLAQYDKSKEDSEEVDPIRAAGFLSAHTGRSDQNYKFRNNNGTPVLNTFDDFDDRRKNAQFRETGFTGFGSVGSGSTDFKVLDDMTYKMQGVPGPGNRQTEKTERELIRNTAGIGSDTKGLAFDWLRLQTRGYWTYYKESFFDPSQEFSSGSSNSVGQLDMYGFHLMPSFVLPSLHQTVRVFLAEEREEYHQELKNRVNERTQKVPARFRNHSSAHIEDEFSFWKKRITLLPSIRYESYRDRYPDARTRAPSEFSNPDKRKNEFVNGGMFASLTFAQTPEADFKLRVGGNQEKRMPTFLELFGEKGSVVGNPSLKPEKSESSEAGVSVLIKNPSALSELSVTGFRKDITDMILFVPNSQFSLRPENVDAARIVGGEFATRIFLVKTIRFYANYSYQRAINWSNVTYLRGKYLPLRPMHDLHSGVSFYTGKFEWGGDADYTGAVFKDRTNEYTGYQQGRWVYALFIKYTPIKSLDRELIFTFEVKNVLDQRLEDVIGYPLPGRTAYGTISYRF